MKIKIIQYLVIFLLSGCAAIKAPGGGPKDTKGPVLISVTPVNNSINIDPKQIITLTFDELLDPSSIHNSIQTKVKYKAQVKGNRIIIKPNKQWEKNSLIEFVFLRKIHDYHKNILTEPIQLSYSTRNFIPKGYISGNISQINDDIVEVGLFTWPLNDSSKFVRKIEAEKDGYFSFNSVTKNNYVIAVIEGSLFNFNKQIYRNHYAINSDDFISLMNKDTVQNIQMLLSEPLEKLSITSSEMLSQYSINLHMSNSSQEKYFIDTLYAPGDSIKINMNKSNRLENYRLPEYSFILPEILDTVNPKYENYKISNDSITIHFSEPIRISNDFVIMDTSLNKINSNLTIKDSYTIILTELSDSINNFLLLGEYIKDFNGNTARDSIFSLYQSDISITPKKDNTGNIFGTINYKGAYNLIVEAVNIDTNEKYYSQTKNNKFNINNLVSGFYKLWAYENLSKKNDAIYFSGVWNPYSRSAKFSIHPNLIEVRARWDIEGIEINFN